LTQIKESVFEAQKAVVEGNYGLVKDIFLPAIRVAVFRSPDIARNDKKPMLQRIEAEMHEWALQADMGLISEPSLFAIMQRPLADANADTMAELEALEALMSY
jgi:hypothetical protein